MDKGYLSQKSVRNGVTAAALLGTIGLSAFGFHRVMAADPKEPNRAAVNTEATARVAEKTAALADLESGFAAIADRLAPSVVSIRVDKSVQMAGGSGFNFGGGGGLDNFFRQFGQDDDNGVQPKVPGGRQQGRGQQPRVFTLPRGENSEEGTPSPRTFHQRGAGSGIVVREDGWILTNDHVAGGMDKVTVTLNDGREFTGKVYRDYRSDLALVKVPVTGLTPAEFADSDQVKVGQWAIAFGSPFELDDTMTAGIISARQRSKQISEDGQSRFYPSLLQTDASINPGNSGGALVDIKGRVIGVNVAINSPSGGSVGIGFAIPSNTARNVMEQLIKDGHVTRGYLGLLPVALTPSQRDVYGVQTGGALVKQVTTGTPADKAGLQVEDVVVRYNGKQVRDDVSFREMVSNTAPNTGVDLVVRRDGHEQTLHASVGAVPLTPEEQAANATTKPASTKTESKFGLQVGAVTADLAKQYSLADNVKGVIVTGVEPGSAAAEAGLRPGMAITRVNGKAVSNPSDLTAIAQGLKSGDTARMVLQLPDADKTNSRILVTLQMP